MSDYSEAKRQYDSLDAQERRRKHLIAQHTDQFMDPGHDPLKVPSQAEIASFRSVIQDVVTRHVAPVYRDEVRLQGVGFEAQRAILVRLQNTLAITGMQAGLGTPQATALTGAAMIITALINELS